MSGDKTSREFDAFVSAGVVSPPDALTDKLLRKVREDLHPSFWFVFTKIFFVHALVGGMTLAVCPQFGIGLLPGHGWLSFLMKYGSVACMVGCGSFFVGSGALAASLLLRPEEVRVARTTRLRQISLLALLSIGVFAAGGANMLSTLVLFWFLGSLVGGVATLELGWFARSLFRRRVVHGL